MKSLRDLFPVSRNLIDSVLRFHGQNVYYSCFALYRPPRRGRYLRNSIRSKVHGNNRF